MHLHICIYIYIFIYLYRYKSRACARNVGKRTLSCCTFWSWAPARSRLHGKLSELRGSASPGSCVTAEAYCSTDFDALGTGPTARSDWLGASKLTGFESLMQTPPVAVQVFFSSASVAQGARWATALLCLLFYEALRQMCHNGAQWATAGSQHQWRRCPWVIAWRQICENAGWNHWKPPVPLITSRPAGADRESVETWTFDYNTRC